MCSEFIPEGEPTAFKNRVMTGRCMRDEKDGVKGADRERSRRGRVMGQ